MALGRHRRGGRGGPAQRLWRAQMLEVINVSDYGHGDQPADLVGRRDRTQHLYRPFRFHGTDGGAACRMRLYRGDRQPCNDLRQRDTTLRRRACHRRSRPRMDDRTRLFQAPSHGPVRPFGDRRARRSAVERSRRQTGGRAIERIEVRAYRLAAMLAEKHVRQFRRALLSAFRAGHHPLSWPAPG